MPHTLFRPSISIFRTRQLEISLLNLQQLPAVAHFCVRDCLVIFLRAITHKCVLLAVLQYTSLLHRVLSNRPLLNLLQLESLAVYRSSFSCKMFQVPTFAYCAIGMLYLNRKGALLKHFLCKYNRNRYNPVTLVINVCTRFNRCDLQVTVLKYANFKFSDLLCALNKISLKPCSINNYSRSKYTSRSNQEILYLIFGYSCGFLIH